MATLDDGPMMNEGQSWISWADTSELKNSNRDDEEEKEKVSRKKHDNDAMKLRKEEMGLFGLCPAWDEFFLVVCEICGRLVKPQALKGHLELRHASSLDRSWDQSELAVPHSTSGKSGSGANAGQRQASSMQQPSSQQQSQLSQQQHMPGGRSASNSTHNASNATPQGNMVAIALPKPQVTKGSGTLLSNHARHQVAKVIPKSTPPLAPAADLKTSILQQPLLPSPTRTSSPTSKKNHGIDPIVRVERITANTVMKKVTTNSSGKELPSPQQPPPVHSAVPMGVLGSTSGPGPGVPASNSLVTVQNVGQPSPLGLLSVRTGEQEVVSVTRKLPISANTLKSKKGSKERKLLLCKDREYDPNKHCGVVMSETSKPCTRSLTCKTHSLSLRRAVCGRKKHFDELLLDHRATKEALLKKSRSGEPSQHALLLHPLGGSDTGSFKSTTASNKMNHSSGGSISSNAVSGISKSSAKSGNKQNSLPTHSRLGPNSGGPCKVAVEVPPQSFPSTAPPQQRLEGATVSKSSSIVPHSPTPDPPYASRHPKPAAMCTFGVWQLGGGRQLLSRHWDQPRAALKAALFSPPPSQHQQHPPLKKLCLESRLTSVSQGLDNSDPYRFTCAESNNNIISSSHLPSSNASPVAAPAPTTGATSSSTICAAEKPPSVTRPLVPTVSNPQLARSLSLQPQPLLSKAVANAQPTAMTKPAKAPPKSDTNKMKNSSTNRHSSSTTTTNHSAPKKRRTNSSSVGSNIVVVSTASATTVTVSAPQTVTIAAASHPATTTLPISFPLTIGDHLGAFSRLQMSTPLVVSRNNLTLAPNVVRQPMVTTANSKDNTVVMDVLNGQLPMLHSVTVSRTAPATTPALLTAGPGGLGITLGAAGLMGQLSQQLHQHQQQKLSASPMVQLSGNKVSNTNWTTGGAGGGSSVKKFKSRKSKGGNMTLNHHHHHHHHHHTNLSSPIGLLIEGQPIGGGLLTATIGGTSNSHLSSSPASSPSPILRTDGLSPLLANGLSSPTLCGGKVLNSGGLQHSPASRTSTPSPGVTLDLSSPTTPNSGQGPKGKGRHTSSFAKSVTAAGHHHSSLSFPIGLPVTPHCCTSPSTAVTQSITYQQVFASQMLTPAQITQLGKKNSGTPLTLTTTALPSKLPLLAQQQHHLFVNSGDDPRRTEDPHSFPT